MPLGACVYAVDDDPVVLWLLQTELRAAGFDVMTAASALEAAIAIRQRVPDVLLLDVNMPQGGGLDLLKALPLLPADRSPPRVLMLTSEDDLHYIQRARELGASGYLVKPIQADQLIAKIRRLLDDAQLRWVDDHTAVRSPDPAQSRAEPTPIPAVRKRILSVEDVPCNQELVRLFLESDRYSVDRVSDGGQALAALRTHRYDLMLLDLRLPDMSGMDLARLVRATETPGVRLPIVALTAEVLPDQVKAARAAGIDDHLPKPFTAEQLRRAAARWLEPAAQPGFSELNPTVATLAQDYGAPVVTKLLSALFTQLGRLSDQADLGPELEQQAHAIRGAAASLGFEEVSNACSALEAACRAGVSPAASLDAAARACADARRDIARLLNAA